MLALLRGVSLRDFRASPGRLILMLGGIASGIALIAALSIINASVLANFRAMLERAAGKAALQVVLGTGEVGFDEAIIELVARDPDVREAFGLVRGTLISTDGSGEVLQLFGIDAVSDAVDSYDIRVVGREGDEVELLNDPTSVFLTEKYAASRHISLGDRVTFGTPSGVRELRVRGLLRPEGIATVFGGALAVMDLPAAQLLLGKERRVDQVDVVLKEDALPATVQRRLTAQLPTSLSITRPALRGEHFEQVIGAFQAMLDGISILCLLAGVFIVYNTSATAVTQRARSLANLIALGAERRTIFALVVIEAVILGVVASLLGIVVGIGLARLLLDLVAQSMGVVYQMRFSVGSLTVGWKQIAWCVALGTASATAAVLVPARKASRLDPLELMRPDFRERLAIASPNRTLLAIWIFLLLCTGAAIYLEVTTRSIAWGNAAATLWMCSIVILAIPLMSGISNVMRAMLPRLFGFNGRLAVESLRRSPGRTGVTTAVIALSLAVAVAISSISKSFRESERDWFILMGDLVVSAVGTEGGWLETPLSGDVAEALRSQPGVARVETYRVLSGQPYREGRIAVVAVTPGFIDTPQFRRQMVLGNSGSAIEAVRDESSVIVSDNFVDRFGGAPGDTLRLQTPAGTIDFPIVGVVAADYSGDQGSVIMNHQRFAALWNDTQVSHFNVFARPGTDIEALRRTVLETLGRKHLIKVLTVPETLAYHQGMVDRAFAFTYAIQLLVVAVTLAGIFDLLTTQIIERRREIGVLRVMGAEEPRLARAIRLEAGVIGLSGALLGVVLAIGTSLLWVHANFRILLGYILQHHFAALTALWCVLLAATVAIVAGHLAARGALRQPALEALRYE